MQISSETLIDFVKRIVEAAGVPAEFSQLVSDSLVASNLRGVDSHGVQLLRFYLEQIAAGDVNPKARGQVVSENGCCLLFDGENGLGQVVATQCCQHSVRLARHHGLGMVVARESNHFGAAAYWAQKFSDQGLIGIVMCNASPAVPPWQGKEGRIGTNPLCVSVPGDGKKLWLLDMATTTVAANKIFQAHLEGKPEIPTGWALDAEGVPTTDTKAAYQGLPMPLGGYKGSGLGMMSEILCAVLGGGAMSTELGGIRIRGRAFRVSQMYLGIDVERFMPLPVFVARMERLIGVIKSAAPARGYDEVLVAGEPEWRAEELRRREGIPLGEGTWGSLVEAAERLGVSVPGVG